MPIHQSWVSMFQAFKKEYGDKEGESYFYAYMRKHGYDETKPREGQKSKSKEFYVEGEISPIVDKQFYGASMQIIDYVEVKDVSGTKFYVEGFLSAPVKDLHGETVSENVLAEWSKECVAPPHNLGWLFHDSPYKSPENKDKPAIYRIIESKISELKDRLGNIHKGLWVKAILNQTHPKFNEVWNMIKTGFINSFSVEFLPELEDSANKLLQKAKYLASCFVMAPAMDLATITSAYAKSFNGGRIEMSEKTLNPVIPQVPDLPADDLEALLRARDQNLARLMGEPIPGVVQPQPNLPLNVPVATVPPVIVPPTPNPIPQPAQNIDPTAQKIDQILQALTGIKDRQDTFEQRLNVVAPAPKDPEPEEIMRIIKYLSGKEDLFKPKPNPQTNKTVTKAVLSPNEDRDKSYSWEEVTELLDQKYEDGKRSAKLVVKAVLDNAPQPTGTSSDLSATNAIDGDSIEGMLIQRDRMFRTQPIGYP